MNKPKTEGITTVGELRLALSKYPDDYPISIESYYWISDETGMGFDYYDVGITDLETRVVLVKGQP